MKKITLLIFVFCLQLSSAYNNDSIKLIFKKSNYLEKIIKNNETNKTRVLVSYVDNYGNNKTTINVKNNNNDFVFSFLPINESVVLYHYFEDNTKYTFGKLQKGDVVEITYDKGFPFMKILNRNVKVYDLNFEINSGLFTPVEYYEYLIEKKMNQNKTKDLYKKTIDDYSRKLKPTLDSLLNINLISNDIADLIYKNGRFQLNNLSKKEFKEFENEFNSDQYLNLISFKNYLINYAENEMNVSVKLERINKKIEINGELKDYVMENRIVDYKDMFSKVENSSLFSYNIKTNILFSTFIKLSNSNDPDIRNYYEKIIKYYKDENFKKKFELDYPLNFDDLKKVSDKLILIDRNKIQTTLDDILKANKGKVIFVDFWASWCAPCREALPYSLKMINELEDVIFIYFSIDSKFENWKKTSEFEKLPVNQSYFVVNPKSSKWILELDVNSIPRYIIFDKNGNLVNKNALGPKTNNLKKELKSY